MPQSLPDTTPPKRRFRWPTGMPQLAALLLVLLVVAALWWAVHSGQFESVEQEGERILRDS